MTIRKIFSALVFWFVMLVILTFPTWEKQNPLYERAGDVAQNLVVITR